MKPEDPMTIETLRSLTDEELLNELERTWYLPRREADPILAEAASRLGYPRVWEDDGRLAAAIREGAA